MLRARPPCVTSRPSRPVAPSVALFFCDGGARSAAGPGAQLSLAVVGDVMPALCEGLIRVDGGPQKVRGVRLTADPSIVDLIRAASASHTLSTSKAHCALHSLTRPRRLHNFARRARPLARRIRLAKPRIGPAACPVQRTGLAPASRSAAATSRAPPQVASRLLRVKRKSPQ